MDDRSHIARAAADTLAALSTPPVCVAGFDGFVDSIIHVVDTRTDMSPRGYTRLSTISAFAARCASAAGRSTNIEQVLLEKRFGGNGPLMAGALARLGSPVTYIGAVGSETGEQIHPEFQKFAQRCRRVIAIGPPSTTDCLEFDDGKLMFNNTAAVQAVTWERITERIGIDALISIVGDARLIGIVNWSLLGGVPGIWRGLIQDVFPRLSPSEGGDRRVFVDLSDPAKRTDTDIQAALALLREIEAAPGVSVTLGLNLAESHRIAAVAGARVFENDASTMGDAVASAARRIREITELDCVVVHPREGAAAADRSGRFAWFDGPFTSTPRLSTGAGDHFNAGFGFGQVIGAPLEQCLAIGCAVSGAYVRVSESPSMDRVTQFLRSLPGPS